MSDRRDGLEKIGWEIDPDGEAGEVHLEHVDSGRTYVLGSRGEIRVPGEGSVGEELRELREALASEADPDGQGAMTESSVGVAPSGIERDADTDAVTIESDTSISLAAPTIDVAGIDPVEVSSPGGVTVSGGQPVFRVELPGGVRHPVAPVESDQSVSEYYGFDTTDDNSAALPDELSVADATVTFLYRNAATGDLSLVLAHDDPASATGGAVAVTIDGASGAEWLVQDGPPENDDYETPEGSFDGAESAAWSWPGDVTDGGAVGPLGGAFDLSVTHPASATVNGETTERSGIDRWLFVDGRAPEDPIEIAAFDDGTGGDVTARVFSAE